MIRCFLDGSRDEFWADEVKIRYSPESILIMMLEGTNWLELELTREIKEGCIASFVCDKFSIHA